MNASNLIPRRPSRAWGALLGLALVAGLVVPSAAAGEHRARMSGELTRKVAAKDAQLLQVILTAPQAEIDRLAGKFKLNVSRRLASGAVFTGTGAQIDALAGDANVKVLVENRKLYSTSDVSTQSTGADQVWAGENGSFDGITGRGVGVVVMDSGIGRHQDLANRVRVRLDFTGPQGKWRFGGEDQYGHGTHVAGIIAGSGKGSRNDDDDDDDAASTPFIGMAPGAALISMKVLGRDGSGYVADVIDAIDFSIRFKNWLGIKVINLSLGHPAGVAYRDDPLAQAVERAVAAGIVVVA
ncbi:MAG: S8 family serine peptidase, partial [Acidobacteria bacterium]|nr:S8 family serine peptidase [Acidobacteriota bacterium]